MYTDPQSRIRKKVLAYFACGPLSNIPLIDFRPYDMVILVDRKLGLSNLPNLDNKAFFQNERFILIEADAICAVDLIRSMGIKIDAFMGWNEGLFEGGGDYPLNGLFFQNFLAPVLEDSYTQVNNDTYYRLRPRRGGIPVLDFIEDGSGTHARNLWHIAQCFHRAGHRFADGVTIRGMVRHHIHPLVQATDQPFIARVRANIWRDDSLDMVLLPMAAAWSEHMPMRRPRPDGSYPENASLHDRKPSCNPRHMIVHDIPKPSPPCMQRLQGRRYGIESDSIVSLSIGLIEKAPRGSRIGMLPYNSPYSQGELHAISTAARVSGSNMYLYTRMPIS